MSSFVVCTFSKLAFSSLILFWVASFSLLRCWPTSRFWSAATLRKSFISKDISPFLLRYLMRNASSSSAFAAFRFSTSLSRALILLIISNHFYFQRANLLLSLNTATDYGGFFWKKGVNYSLFIRNCKLRRYLKYLWTELWRRVFRLHH